MTFLLAESGIGKFLPVESEILGIEIWNSAEGVRNPTNSFLIYGRFGRKQFLVSVYLKKKKKKNLTGEIYMFTIVLGSQNNSYTCKLHL